MYSRGSEPTQRSPNLGDSRGSSQLRKSNSELDPSRRSTVSERSSKLRGGRSSRGSQSDPVNQKRFGSRIAGLESQLQLAQEELKNLKDQLTSAQAAKEQAEQELEKKDTDSVIPEAEELLEEHSPPIEIEESNETDANENDSACQQETDVFEVPVEKSLGISQPNEDSELNVEVNSSTITAAISEPGKQIVNELALKNEEISLLVAKMGEKESELTSFSQENENLKTHLHEATMEISSARVKEEELKLRLRQVEEELRSAQGQILHSNALLETVEGEKEALETEMTRLRVQTEQWRKAADAAALVLAGDAEMNARGLSTRFESMDKHYCSAFEPPLGGYAGFLDSQGLDNDSDDGYGNGKKKSSGVRMFGDLWKKKSQK